MSAAWITDMTPTDKENTMNTKSENDGYCCPDARYVGLVLDEAQVPQVVCGRHASTDVVDRVRKLDGQASSVGAKRRSGGLVWHRRHEWPYGANNRLETREAMVAWAQGHGVTLAKAWDSPCLHWLLSGRCGSAHCHAGMTEYGFAGLRACGVRLESDSWLDHITGWSRDGLPAALVVQPYWLSDENREALQLLGAKPGLRVEISDDSGWYGLGTTWIAIWREHDLSLVDPVPVCDGCGVTRSGSWAIHQPSLTWHCNGCHRPKSAVERSDFVGAGEPLSRSDRRARDEAIWLMGDRRDLIQWMRTAQFLHDAPAIAGGER